MPELKCKYCGNQMSEYDFKTNNGLCLKCLEIQDWKNIIKDYKQYKD
jgi:hypothetical protein